MSVYKKFGPHDVTDSKVYANPRISVAYGQGGWRGNVGPSASISLYEGVRSRTDVKHSNYPISGLAVYPLDDVDTHSIDKVIQVSGSYPSTGSIRYIRCFNDPYVSKQQVTSERWYEEHYRPIELLYDYYQRFDEDYFIGSYDFYSVFLPADQSATGSNDAAGPYFNFSGAFIGKPITGPTSSFTAMAWIKPIPIGTSSLDGYAPTFFSQKNIWNMYLFEETPGKVGLYLGTEPNATGSAKIPIELGKWNHVAVAVSGGVSASFVVNGVLAETLPMPNLLAVGSDATPLLVGAYIDANDDICCGLNGFLFESQVWNKYLNPDEIADLAAQTTFNSSSANLVHYARYNDGPLGTGHGFAPGSGTLDHSPRKKHGQTVPWSFAHTVHWMPNDHPTFMTKKKKVNLNLEEIRVIHIPSMFYGRSIATGSVRVTCGNYNERKVVRVFVDDGRGGLYVSGSMTRDVSGEEYQGNDWRKVGNVFYTEGLIVFTEPALYDMFDNGSGSFFWDPGMAASGTFGDLLSVDFKGNTIIHATTFNCLLGPSQANSSNNPTFSYLDTFDNDDPTDDRFLVKNEDGFTYITAIGLYNEDRKLVAVAKLAQPIRKREKDKITIRLRMDF